jgi:hypothetical protein
MEDVERGDWEKGGENSKGAAVSVFYIEKSSGQEDQ